MVRLKLVVPREPSAFTVNFVIKANVFANVEFDSVADHMPLILPAAWEFDPQAEKIRHMPNNTIAAVLFMGCSSSPFSGTREAAPLEDAYY